MINLLFFYIAIFVLILAFIIKEKTNKMFLYFLSTVIFNILLVKNFFDILIITLISIAYFLFLIFIVEDKNHV